MTYDDFHDRLEEWWADTDARAIARKDSQGALLELMKCYEGRDPGDRAFADRVLEE